MPRLALHAATLVGVVAFAGCGSDSAPRPGASAGAGGGAGQSAGGAAQAVSGAGAMSGPASGGSTAGGSVTGGAGSAQAAGSAGTGVAGAAGSPAHVSGTPLVYVGGFGDFPLRVYALDLATGALTQRGTDVDAGPSPSYLTLAPSGGYLYNVNEDNGAGAGVTAHRIKADGTLEPLNHQQGSDKSPQACNGSCGFTFAAVDPSAKLIIAAAYDGGSVSVFPLTPDGSLGAERQLLDFGGQAKAHSVAFDASGAYAFVPTLGLDKVQQLKLGADGLFGPNTPAAIASAANAGPRHVALHPNGKLAFVMNETNSSMTPYAISADGKLTPGASVSSLPAGYSGETYGQHVKVSPNGRFVYGSNVGHDSIAVFSIEPSSGALTLLQNQPAGGAWPRDFDVDPNAEVLVAANRDSGTLTVFKLGADGKLTPLGQPTKVPAEPTAVVIRYQP